MKQTNLLHPASDECRRGLKSLPLLWVVADRLPVAALCLVLFMLLPLATSCGSRPYPSSLLAADSLCTADPERALSLLDSLASDTQSLSLRDRMYYRLLRVKAADKAYMPHTSDSLIRPIVDHYVSGGDPHLLPEALYYAGRVYRDLGDSPQALDYFKRSLDAMEGNDRPELRGKVYSQTGTLFFSQHAYAEALESFKCSYQCNARRCDTAGLVFSCRDIGNIYRCLDRVDSALHYFREACRLAKIIGRTDLYRGVQSQKASLLIDLGRLDQAHAALKTALQEVARPDRSGVYTIAGKYYRTVGMLDSAAWYYKEILRTGTVYSKEIASRHLSLIAYQKKEIRQSMDYWHQHLAYSDSVNRLNHSEEVRQAHAVYNYRLREKETLRLQKSNETRRQQNIWLLFSLSASAGLLLFFYFSYRHRSRVLLYRLQRAESLKAEAYRRSEQFKRENDKRLASLEAEIQSLRHSQENMSAVRERLEKEKKILCCTNRQVELEQEKCRLLEDTFFSSEVYLRFKRMLASSSAPSGQDWKDLQERMDECYGKISSKLSGLYRMSVAELRICLLVKAGFRNKEIARLVGLSAEGTTSVRRRLYAKLFNEKGDAKKLNEFISSL